MEGLGSGLRKRREAAGLTQVAAARAAGVGRSTLIHFEQGGKDVRISNVIAMAKAVGATVLLQGESSEGLQRLQLRREEDLKLARRREQHLRLALDLALGRPRSAAILERARAMVALWRRNRTCSEFYIDGWSRVLKGDPPRVARSIRDIEPEWLDAMLQNTPFGPDLAGR